ncbi:hypothetical protein LAZ67_1007499 [Cordylochernes scorpioides]|uniref:Transposase n=1 Tax=Cordylochernes scorpioides TaxID=51811 RepID=A0ABY6JZN4_9ARAC|nr:hypothetical protein LAZ67_1007499 [Cordylochernes scorpioides]
MVRRWRSWFLEGRQNVHDDERSGSPVTSTDNAAVAAVRNVVEADRRVTIDEIMIRLPPGIKIRRSSIGTIMSDVWNFRKVCARWVPRLLWKITSNNVWRQPELFCKCIEEMEINCFPVLSLEMKAGCIIQLQKQNDKAWCGRSLRKVHQKRRRSQSLQAKLWLWKTPNGKFSHIHLILRNLPQANSIFIQHSSGTLEASTLRMMTKCRRRRTTGYEDRTRLGTTVVSKNCYNEQEIRIILLHELKLNREYAETTRNFISKWSKDAILEFNFPRLFQIFCKATPALEIKRAVNVHR